MRIAVDGIARPLPFPLMARPTKFTEAVRSDLLSALRGGTPIRHAVAFAGISESVYHVWRKRGEEYELHLEKGGDVVTAEQEFLDFVESIRQAQGQAVVGALLRIREAMNGRGVRVVDGVEATFASEPDWRAAAWYLEHCHPREFSKVTAAVFGSTSGGDTEGDGIDLETAIAALMSDLDEKHEQLQAQAKPSNTSG